ncbi:DUF4194 domain-containing protein [Yersinia similis]|uniref:DUF4194 domain-containing protein n=1 Tax=Yersinia similis TaxID=367190 RepID=A0A0T9RGV2_9GAMM|nr:DUF4194 domain-containing protein [Yersinia similis]CNC47606.1 Uncharacterised protein [Yersinia similis]CNG43583.1 Uncharacterised protein [Yersinia similis]CNI61934.1 Uncharacterised protein [Yersinia similis]
MTGIFDRLVNTGNGELTQDVLSHIERDDMTTDALPDTDSESTEEKRTHKRVREAAQELLKYGLLEESHKPNLYRIALIHTEEMASILEPLDLSMGIDEVRGLLFVMVRQQETSEQDDWTHPLVRRQRLNLEQSLLIAILRQHFIAYEQENGIGASQALVAVDDLIPQLQVYLGDLGSDARERTRVINLLDQLKGHGLVSTPDAHERVIVRPIIAHLANPENLQALLAWLRDQVERSELPGDASELMGGEEMP